MSGGRPGETLYRLPTYSQARVQSVLLTTLVWLGLDVVASLLAGGSYLAGRWYHLPELGAPWLPAPGAAQTAAGPAAAGYPRWGVLALAVGATAAAALPLAVRRLRRWWPAPALAPPLLLALYLAALGPVYSPAAFLRWSQRYQGVAALGGDVRRAQTLLRVTLCGLCASTVGYALLRLRDYREEGDTHGSSHWASAREVAATGLLGQGGEGVVVGAWEDRRGRLHRLRDRRDRHVLAFAPSGSGKSTCLVIPTLLEWPGSIVVLDVKGELWHRTAGYRREKLGNVCVRFDPACANGSAAGYNPLLVIPRGPEDVKYAQSVADVLVDPEGRDRPRSFWEQASHALLVGSILHVLYAERDKSLAGCARLLSDPRRPIAQTLDAMLHTHHDPELEMGWVEAGSGEPTPTHPVVAATARSILDLDPRTASGVIGNAQSRLDLFRDPILAGNTAASDFTAEDLVFGERPMSLYIALSPAELDRLRGLLRILLNQLCRRLTERLDFAPDGGRPAGRRPLLLLLDEFAVLGKLDFFGRAMAYLRGYGIRVYLSIQSLSQLYDIYGQHQSITANCPVQVAFAPADVETAELLSKMTGQMTVNLVKRSLSGASVAVTPRKTTVSQQEVGRPLLTSEEVRRLPDGEALVFTSGHAPIRGRRVPYWRDGRLAERCAVAPPARSDRVEREWEWGEGEAYVAPHGSEGAEIGGFGGLMASRYEPL
ncbi:MAG TPA: type IV secretory system conjugative DNA transfer family protein [Thermoanaerobaculia bacterium]|nr:type IV secretory system conjugative DNA transfer family protein [Thermoanaerobaculia bacterium]